MKKFVLSLFFAVTLFFNVSSVLAVADGTDKMATCMSACSSQSDMDEGECKTSCSADIYDSVSNCINGCSNVGSDSCKESCLTNYLNKSNVSESYVKEQCEITSEDDIDDCVSSNLPSYSERMDTCLDSCIDISDMSGSRCSTWCISYISDTTPEKASKTPTSVDCAGVIIPSNLIKIVNTIVNLIKIAVPIMLVIFGMLDLAKSVMSQKEDEIKKGQHMFVKRLIAAVIVFLVFVVVQLVIGIVAPRSENENMWNCVDCLINGDCG